MMSVTKVLFTLVCKYLKYLFKYPSNWLSIADIEVITYSLRTTVKSLKFSGLTNSFLLSIVY